MSDADYLLALKLQNELNGDDSDIVEVAPPVSKSPLKLKRSNPHSNLDEDFLNRTQNLVHPQWETLDPTPDIKGMFHEFDRKFFQGRLKCVMLEWSKKMYSCAGICYMRRNSYGMDVTIRLSEPLLKLRPRKDLVETMLHEMIHAYCFVLNIREGNGGHGPNFKRIMVSINKVAGTNITVYHTFHDEVEVYKQHWWRCNGICQNRSPFYGYVKRTSNRAPGANDQWWAAHNQSCGGTFMKIKEPEKHKKQKPSKAIAKVNTPSGAGDLRKFFVPTRQPQKTTPPPFSKAPTSQTQPKTLNGPSRFNGPVKTNGGGTMLLNPKTTRPTTTANTNPIASAFPPTSYPGLSSDPFNMSSPKARTAVVPAGGNLRNVKGFRDLNSSADGDSGGGGNAGRVVSGVRFTVTSEDMFGRGYSLDSNTANNVIKSPEGQVDRNHLRNLWATRFGGSNDKKESDGQKESRPSDDTPPAGDSKRRKTSDDMKEKETQWISIEGDDLFISETPQDIVVLSDTEDENEEDEDNNTTLQPILKTKMSTNERQTIIKQEILDETTDMKDEDIVLIDDEYDDDDDTTAASEIADTTVVDEFFGDDTLIADFERENYMTVLGGRSRVVNHPNNDIITCPICQEKMRRCVLGDHLNGCMGISVKVLAPKHSLKKLASTSRKIKPTQRSPRSSTKTSKDILREAGYSDADIERYNALTEAMDQLPLVDSLFEETLEPSLGSSPGYEDGTRRHRQRSIYKTTRQCPRCAKEIDEELINEHLDECLLK